MLDVNTQKFNNKNDKLIVHSDTIWNDIWSHIKRYFEYAKGNIIVDHHVKTDLFKQKRLMLQPDVTLFHFWRHLKPLRTFRKHWAFWCCLKRSFGTAEKI